MLTLKGIRKVELLLMIFSLDHKPLEPRDQPGVKGGLIKAILNRILQLGESFHKETMKKTYSSKQQM